MTTIQPRQAVVTIYQGDFIDRIRHLERQALAAVEAEGSAPRMLSEVPESHRIAEEHDELVKEAEESAIHVRVQALGRRAWKALVAEHPPREGNDGDKTVGVNEETFQEALVAVSIAEPVMDEAGTTQFIDSVADADFMRIYYTAFALNRTSGGDPKAGLASRLTHKSDEN